jgi:hypothetical protein
VILMLRLCGLQVNPWDNLHRKEVAGKVDFPWPVGPRQLPNNGQFRGNANFREMRAYNRFVGHAVMVSRFLEIIPGLIVLYFSYKILLRVGHRLVRGQTYNYVNRLFKCRGPIDQRNGYGFQSGNYGYPIRKPWLFVQTALLCFSILVVRIAINLILLARPSWLVAACEYVSIAMPSPSWKAVTNSGQRLLVSYVVFALQFFTLDYLLKYRPSSKSRDGDSLFLGQEEWMEQDGPESIPMEELTLEVPEIQVRGEPESSEDSIYPLALRSPMGPGYNSVGLPARELPRARLPITIPLSPSLSHRDSIEDLYDSPISSEMSTMTVSSQSPLTSVSGSPSSLSPPVSVLSMPADSTVPSRPPISTISMPTDTTLPLRYGLVTAGLLNAASVGITLRNRSFLFGNSDAAEESVEIEDTIEEEGLPSYDDSQRQQQALLRDTSQLIQRDALIAELKRN